MNREVIYYQDILTKLVFIFVTEQCSGKKYMSGKTQIPLPHLLTYMEPDLVPGRTYASNIIILEYLTW